MYACTICVIIVIISCFKSQAGHLTSCERHIAVFNLIISTPSVICWKKGHIIRIVRYNISTDWSNLREKCHVYFFSTKKYIKEKESAIKCQSKHFSLQMGIEAEGTAIQTLNRIVKFMSFIFFSAPRSARGILD